jgi:hypothetical protein
MKGFYQSIDGGQSGPYSLLSPFHCPLTGHTAIYREFGLSCHHYCHWAILDLDTEHKGAPDSHPNKTLHLLFCPHFPELSLLVH